ncbi:MAG: hypothetical protein H0T73_12845 [Ardenticatenales bacterium]|nr:hypothetical protein [Ardenticatenales bacterium]
MKHLPLPLLCLLLCVLLSACDTGRGAVSDTYTDGLVEGTIWSEHRIYRQEELLHARFTLKNITEKEVVLERADGPVVDIFLSGGAEGGRWSEGAGASQDLSRLVLQPGESYLIEWTAPPLQQGNNVIAGEWWGRLKRRESASVSICVHIGSGC